MNYCKRIRYNQTFCLEISFSQNPRSGSIALSNSYDRFGLKKINIKWDFFKGDIRIYKEIVKKITKILSINNKYRLNKSFENVYVGQHPSCSTPITKNLKIIGVDKNLKLNGYKNVYTIGSNVFPENGFTNPTWTIMTLTLKLTRYLLRYSIK
jgi:choline dehydrogenase-like flavoprotein